MKQKRLILILSAVVIVAAALIVYKIIRGDQEDSPGRIVEITLTKSESSGSEEQTASGYGFVGSSPAEISTTTTDTETSTDSASNTEQETSSSETTSEPTSPSLSGTAHFGESGGFYNEIVVTDVSKGILMLVNKKYRLPDDFQPDELVEIPSNYHVQDGKEYMMQKEAADAFYQMSGAAWKETGGAIDLRIVSGYRSKSYQEWLYGYYEETYGKQEADSYSARPRHSEHETGLACDIGMVEDAYQYTEDYKWLMENAHLYGYILRYPLGKEHITGYIYESWHFRYVGVETAMAVKESGLTYEEYYEKFIGDSAE